MPDTTTAAPEAWLDKKGLARHFSCSVRSIEFAVADGCPHAIVFGRVKFQVSEVTAWLEKTGGLERRGADRREYEAWLERNGQTADTVLDDGMGPAAE